MALDSMAITAAYLTPEELPDLAEGVEALPVVLHLEV